MNALNRSELQCIRDLVYRESSISTQNINDHTIESHLKSIVRRENLPSLSELVSRVRSNDAKLTRCLIEKFTVNETSFFRDKEAFNIVCTELLPALLKNTDKQVTIWCVGCSSGQEVYSLLISMLESFEVLEHQVRIIGTDISETVIQKAERGRYSELEMKRGMCAAVRQKYFSQSGEAWDINPEYKKFVHFNVANLNGGGRGFPDRVDIIFLRNILIYFDEQTRKNLLHSFTQVLSPGGHVFLGSSESALPQVPGFKRLNCKSCHYYTVS